MDISRSLEKANILHSLSVVHNGEEALELLNKTKGSVNKKYPDIVLIDINMPKMNGLELLEKIRSEPEWKHLKCFIITTSNHKSDRMAAKEFEVSGYIIKPLKLNGPSNMDSFNLMIDLMNFKTS